MAAAVVLTVAEALGAATHVAAATKLVAPMATKSRGIAPLPRLKIPLTIANRRYR